MNKAKALTAYLAEREPAPFDWRTANCLHFAGGFVALVEPADPLAGVEMPATLAAARRRQARGGGLQAIVTAQLAREPIVSPLFAQVGDVVLLPLDETDNQALAVGICCGEQAVCTTEDGSLTYHPMGNAIAAWRIGA